MSGKFKPETLRSLTLIMNNDTQENTITVAHLIQTIRRNDFDGFKKLMENYPEKLSWLQNDFGLMLLREVIREDRKEIFLNLLQFQDTEERRTALRYMLDFNSNQHEYYIHELIKDSTLIHENYKLQNLLHWSVGKFWFNLTKFLLEEDVDPNLRDKFDDTPLHKILLKSTSEDDCEFISMLLYYGADPLIETYKGYNSFELSVMENRSVLIQEILFYHTFDAHSHVEIFCNVLLILAKRKSSLFYEILTCDVEFVVDYTPTEFFNTFQNLLKIDLDDLQLLLEKQGSMVSEIFEKCNNDILYPSQYQRDANYFFQVWQRGIYSALKEPTVLRNLDFLWESSDSLRLHIRDLCVNLQSSRTFVSLVSADASNLLFYMLTHGLRVDRVVLDLVFNKYGYSELFRLLLHLDHQINERNYYSRNTENALVALICNVNAEAEEVFENLDKYSVRSVERLIDFCAHAKLIQYLLYLSRIGQLSEEMLRRVENHPRVPCLLELSRNVFRKYLVTTFSIESAKFYGIVNALPVSRIYKDIVTFKKKLY